MQTLSTEAAEQKAEQRLRHYIDRFPELDPWAVRVIQHLFNTHRVIGATVSAWLGPSNTSLARLHALTILEVAEGQRLSIGALSSSLLVSPPNVTRLVDGLVRLRLVTRSNNRRDRREVFVKLTPAGKDLLTRALPLQFAAAANITATLSLEERKRLVSLLSKLCRGAATSRVAVSKMLADGTFSVPSAPTAAMPPNARSRRHSKAGRASVLRDPPRNRGSLKVNLLHLSKNKRKG